MPTPAPDNGRSPTDPRNEAASGRPDHLADLIAQAEELRRLLHEAGGRLQRLTADLKQFRRHSRVFQQALSSLRQLNLDG